MGILSFWKTVDGPNDRGLELLRAVRKELPTASDDDVKVIASIVGLLGQVAYADRPYMSTEETRIRQELGNIVGLSQAGADAICATLRGSIATVADVEAREYARFLRELADRDLRLRVLDLLLDVAAADDEVSLPEVNLIRRLTDVLGLTQADYNTSQARYQDKLGGVARR